MEVSAISHIGQNNARKNLFIRYSNSFMSSPEGVNPFVKSNESNPSGNVSKAKQKMGIENLEEFTIFPKEVVDGRTIIQA